MEESSLPLSTVCSEGASAGQLLWAAFLSCVAKTTIPLHRGTQNLIPIKSIRGVRHISTLQIHPIGGFWIVTTIMAFPSVELKAVSDHDKMPSYGCYRRKRGFSHFSPSLTLLFWPSSSKTDFSPTKFKTDNCTPDLEPIHRYRTCLYNVCNGFY